MKICRIALLVFSAALASPLHAQQLDPFRSLKTHPTAVSRDLPYLSSVAADGAIGAMVGAPAAAFLALFPVLILTYDSGPCHANSIAPDCYAGHTALGLASAAGAAAGSKWTGGEAALVPSMVGGLVGGLIGGALYFRHEYYTSGDPWTSAPSNSYKLATLIPGAVAAYIGNRLGQ